MRDLRRPAAHPLVELVHDLRDLLDEAESDGTATTLTTRLYQRLHGTLRSARRLVDALELLVAEMEEQADRVDRPRADEEVDDDDFQRIHVQ